jgi:putative spermidine/putrescine transport system permease protein
MTRFVLPGMLAAVGVFLLAPIAIVVLTSFSASAIFAFPPKAYTTDAYWLIPSSFIAALRVSLIVAATTAVIAVIVGVPAAIALVRGRFPGRDSLNALCLSPLSVPALVIGVALFQSSIYFWDITGLTLGGTIAGLVIGHLTFTIPYVIRSVVAAQAQFDPSIEEAAANLGASPAQIFFRITLPSLRPGIASGAIFAILMSLDDVPVALFMGGSETTTLPVKILAAIEFNFGADIMAISSLVIFGSIALMIVLDRMVSLETLFSEKS